MTPETPPEIPVTGFACGPQCKDGEHDWSGPPYERATEGGGSEGGATCAKCGMEFGHFAIWAFD